MVVEENKQPSVHIRIDDNTELIIDESFHQAYDNYLKEKYPPETTTACEYQPGESLPEYLERIKTLFNKPEQIAYIDALATLIDVGTVGMYALQSYAHAEEIHPKITQYYPPEQHQAIMGKGTNREMLDEAKTYLQRDKANELIVNANRAAYFIKQKGDRVVKEARASMKQVVLGEKPLEGLPFSAKLKVKANQARLAVAQALVGKEQTEHVVDGALAEIITHNSLELLTEESAKTFHEVAEHVNGPIKPIELYANYVS